MGESSQGLKDWGWSLKMWLCLFKPGYHETLPLVAVLLVRLLLWAVQEKGSFRVCVFLIRSAACTASK